MKRLTLQPLANAQAGVTLLELLVLVICLGILVVLLTIYTGA